jgi:predicted nucleotide-binding protein (sugar kinase/HSP70/actin superfamily)
VQSSKFYRNQIEDTGLTTIFIAAHPYLIHDHFLNLNIVEKLKKMGCQVILPEEIPLDLQNAELSYLGKPLFWSFGKMQLGSVRFISRQPGAKGVIILSSFGCGIDSFIDNMIVRHLKKTQIPYLNIILDEHSGAAGLDTRVEAFLDMLRWKENKDEDYVSTYGSYLGCDEGVIGASGAGCSCTTLLQ